MNKSLPILTLWVFIAVAPFATAFGALVVQAGPAVQAAPNAAAVEPGTSGSRLERARPDPFVTSTQVAYELARAGRVRLSVFDLHGREVSVLEDGPLAAGPHTVTWRAQDHGGVSIPAGAYFIRLQLPEGGERVERVVRLR